MDEYTKCLVCGGEGFVEVAGIHEGENDSIECPACEVSGVVAVMPF